MFAQGPTAPETPLLDTAKSAVTVVFSPDYSRATRSLRDKVSLRSINTPPSRIMSAMTGGRIDGPADSIEFPAPKGLTGIRTGAESVMAAIVTTGDDGKPHLSCSRLPQALERLKSANTGHSTGKDTANDR